MKRLWQNVANDYRRQSSSSGSCRWQENSSLLFCNCCCCKCWLLLCCLYHSVKEAEGSRVDVAVIAALATLVDNASGARRIAVGTWWRAVNDLMGRIAMMRWCKCESMHPTTNERRERKCQPGVASTTVRGATTPTTAEGAQREDVANVELLPLLPPLLAICQRQLAIEPLFWSCPCLYDNCAFHLIRKLMSNSISGRTTHDSADAVAAVAADTLLKGRTNTRMWQKGHIQCRALTSASNLFPIWALET